MPERLVLCFCLILASASCMLSQVMINDSVCHAEKVVRIERSQCVTLLHLRTSTGFSVGDRVLIHQVRGGKNFQEFADDDGRLDTIGHAGLFEFNWIANIQGNIITLRDPLANTYVINNQVQLVKVIYAPSLQIVGKITAKPWDEACGGVIAIEADSDIIMVRPIIDATGLGFIGGDMSMDNYTCDPGLEMFAGAPSTFYGAKGQGIVEALPYKGAGRAKLANGGGGGGNHNSGGGGGGNGGAGGNGGRNWRGCPTAETHGLGGSDVPQTRQDPRLIFGGGGGGGHQDEARLGSRGGNGGGAIIISTRTLTTHASLVSVNGESVTEIAKHNGAAGGGGAGTIILDADTCIGMIQLRAMGGNGGDVDGSDPEPCGPGGGGGGGSILFTPSIVPTTFFRDVSAGQHGINVAESGALSTWYSEDGNDGLILDSVRMPVTPSTTVGNVTLLGPIDLGTHPSFTSFDSTTYVVNTSSHPVDVFDVRARYGRIEILSTLPDVPHRLSPGDSIQIFLRVAVTQGEEQDSIIVSSNGCDSAVAGDRRWRSINDSAGACSVNVTLATTPCSVGDVATIAVIITDATSLTPPRSFTVGLEAKSAILDLQRAQIQGALVSDAFSINEYSRIVLSGLWTGGDTICTVHALTLLNKNNSTPVRFAVDRPLEWNGPCNTVTSNTVFEALDVCATRKLRSIRVNEPSGVRLLYDGGRLFIERLDTSTEPISIRVFDVRGVCLTTTSMHQDPIVVHIPSGWMLVVATSQAWTTTSTVFVR